MRECPYCEDPIPTFLDPCDWVDHLHWSHMFETTQGPPPYDANNRDAFTWEEAHTWYHAQLLGVTP